MSTKLTLKKRIYFYLFRSLRRGYWSHFFQLERTKIEENIPKVNLRNDNIQNLKVLLNRDALLKNMPKNKVVAEIGVDRGDFSELIIKTTSPQKLHLIDAWSDDSRYHVGLKSIVAEKLKKEIDNGIVDLDVGFSTSVLANFPDAYFDWVYLDTDHSYQTTKEELAILKFKVKPDGIIAGHDYTLGNWVSNYRYGVIEAVNEFCVNENWEIIFLTSETDQHYSFAIKRSQP
jgi:hypothetical protein